MLDFHPNKKVNMMTKYENGKVLNKLKLFKQSGFILYKGEHEAWTPNGYGIRYYPESNCKQFVGTFSTG